MARTLNHEVSILNVSNQDNDLKDAFTRDMICDVEETRNVASRAYSAGDTFIWTDRKVYRAKQAIASGAGLSAAANGNIEAVGTLAKLKQALSDEVSARAKLGAHQLLLNKAVTTTVSGSGVTFTVDQTDKTVLVTTDGATALSLATITLATHVTFPKGTYRVSGTPSGGNFNTGYALYVQNTATYSTVATDAENASGLTDTFTVTDETTEYNVIILVRSGASANNKKFYPMICDEKDTDTTYLPYAPTNRECLSHYQNGVLGAKNILPFPYQSGGTQVINGITFTVSNDGTVGVNGTASDSAVFYFNSNSFSSTLRDRLLGKVLTLSGGVASNCYVQIWNYDGSGSIAMAKSDSDEVSFTFTNSNASYNIAIVVSKGAVISNKTIKPMLRLASDTDQTYQPYAMTNRELTKGLMLETVSGYTWNAAIDSTKIITVYKLGKIVFVYGYWKATTALAPFTNIVTGLPKTKIASLSSDHKAGTSYNLFNEGDNAVINLQVAGTANLQSTFSFVYLADED